MTRPEFQSLIASIRADQDKLLAEKGADYTQQSPDVHHNFKVVAEWTGLTPLQVWSVYFAKHILAIMSYVKNGDVKSESIEGRFRDAGNYLLLGEGILPEENMKCGMLFQLHGHPIVFRCELDAHHLGDHRGNENK
jgi:hypothetical protein